MYFDEWYATIVKGKPEFIFSSVRPRQGFDLVLSSHAVVQVMKFLPHVVLVLVELVCRQDHRPKKSMRNDSAFRTRTFSSEPVANRYQ